MTSSKLTFSLGILVLALCALSSIEASIDREPVKVTHKNSGPEYDISDDVEKVKIPTTDDNNPKSLQSQPKSDSPSSGNNDDEDSDIGHVSIIRRVFLIPLSGSPASSPSSSPMSSSSNNDAPFRVLSLRPMVNDGDNDEFSASSAPMHPLWPLFHGPPRQSVYNRPHLLGGDEASRSPVDTTQDSQDSMKPSSSSNDASESGPVSRVPSQIDPVDLILKMMLNSINSHPMMPPSDDTQKFFTDLNREASGDKSNNSGENKPVKPPTSTNETKEEIVEIDGKKFIRKMQINRHVGDNIVFVTRRLIFVPLNETDIKDPATTTLNNVPTELPSLQSSTPKTSQTDSVTTTEKKEVEEPATTLAPPEMSSPSTTTTTTTSTSENPNVVSSASDIEKEGEALRKDDSNKESS